MVEHIIIKINRIHLYLLQLSYWKFIFTILLMTYLVVLPYLPFVFIYEHYIGLHDPNPVLDMHDSIFKIVVFGIIIAPIIETFVAQHIIIKFLSSFKALAYKKYLIIILSSIVFGIGHTQSVSYMIMTFAIGLLLAYSYLVFMNRPQSAFWTTALIHSLRNSVTAIFLVTSKLI